MVRNLKLSTACVALGVAISGLLLTSCDRQSERVERAQEIADAALRQINGEVIVEKDTATSPVETASVMDRAISGAIRNDLGVEIANARSKFAIGSIIAKPKDIPPPPSALEIDAALDDEFLELELSEEAIIDDDASPAPVPLERSESVSPQPEAMESVVVPEEVLASPAQVMPKIKLDPKAREQTQRAMEDATNKLERTAVPREKTVARTRSVSPRAITALPKAERVKVKKLARRTMLTQDAIQAQKNANNIMLDTLSKYGVDGQVSLSREGQMVIQVNGADPTQFSPQDASSNVSADFLALEDETGCPETADMVTVQSNPRLATECIVKDLRATGQFEYVEKDYIFENQFARKPRPKDPQVSDPNTGDAGDTSTPDTPTVIAGQVTPNDPLWALQWHFLDRGEGENQSAGGAGFQSFWSRQATTGSEEIVVAVVDTGLQMEHPDIKNSPNVAQGWDMVSDPRMGNDGDGRDSDANDPGDMCDPTVPYAEDTFHGTHVAGTIGAAATNNGSGVAGGAWEVKIVPVRALGKCGGRLSDINDAIRWAGGLIPAEGESGEEVWNDNPADIINLSIGLFEYCPASLQDAIDAVVDEGVLVVSAAGNARVSTEYYAPGGCQNVISVAASDARGQIAPYSNFGKEVDILAPGGDLTRDDNGDGRPDGVLSTKAASNCYDPVTGEAVDDCFYAYEQGTSMAAPHVSAALALLMARSPEATPEELTATLIGALDTRSQQQCAGSCALYPGTAPIEGEVDLCWRPCGDGLLNLANVPEIASGAGSD